MASETAENRSNDVTIRCNMSIMLTTNPISFYMIKSKYIVNG